jgi:hypothetical protein
MMDDGWFVFCRVVFDIETWQGRVMSMEKWVVAPFYANFDEIWN